MIQLANVPISGGAHLGLPVVTRGRTVTLTLVGHRPAGPVLFQLPAFVGNLRHATAGAIDPGTGTVTLSATTRSVPVTLDHQVCSTPT